MYVCMYVCVCVQFLHIYIYIYIRKSYICVCIYIASPIRNPHDACFNWYLMRLRLKHCSSCCVSLGPNLVWSCRQRVPSCTMLHMTWTSMCITWLQFRVHRIATSAQHDQLQLGLQFSQSKIAAPGQFCGLNATRWKLAFLPLFVPGHVAHIGPVLGPTSTPDAPTQDQVAQC